MSLTVTSINNETETSNDLFYDAGGNNNPEATDPEVTPDKFFTSDLSEYIDSMTILPAGESLEQLNNFFDETTSTTPAENAENLVRAARAFTA